MSRSSRIVVLGSRGLLGAHVVAVLREARTFPVVSLDAKFQRGEDLSAALLANEATTVVNCAGYTGTDPTEHLWVNACIPRVIADFSQRAKCLFIQISTNAVFSIDESRRWHPGDLKNPTTPYEVSKSLGEDPRAYVVRSSFIGVSPKGSGVFDQLRAGKPYRNRLWNGVTALALARCFVTTIQSYDGIPTAGIEHVYSPKSTSFAAIAEALKSSSEAVGTSSDARLLGGGTELPEVQQQLDEYRSWLSRSEVGGTKVGCDPHR